jgi:hypothetical protein
LDITKPQYEKLKQKTTYSAKNCKGKESFENIIFLTGFFSADKGKILKMPSLNEEIL